MNRPDDIPSKPGCYFFKNFQGKPIYIGKAKDLKKRVTTYFLNKNHDEKTALMLKQAEQLDFMVTDSEVEALILENNLIKKHQPKYNINLKDSKRYAYLQITDEEFPRLLLARVRLEKGKFFGPFVSAETRDYVKETLTKRFQIRTCKRFPKKPCLRYHIKICSAPCIDAISKTAYDKNVKAVTQILKGDTKNLSKNIKERMKYAAQKTDFEHAITLRNQLQAIDWLDDRQKMERHKKYDEDIINLVEKDGRTYLILFNVRAGILENRQAFEFQGTENILEEFITRYYSENKIPGELILPLKVNDSLKRYLRVRKKKPVRIVVPKIGEKKQLLDLVKKNIDVTFFAADEKLSDLMKHLKLYETPRVIECFDISHLSGTSTVGSMVQFRNGVADKSNYRRFKIRTVEGIDDTASIGEVVKGRYSRLKAEKREFPNLIIIDGGRGQLNAALKQLAELELRIPVISIAKKFEEIHVPGLKIALRLDRKGKALRLIQQIRDEAHRFAIKYNRLLRKKKFKADIGLK